MIKKIVIVLVAALGIFAAVVATRPSAYSVSRAAIMTARPAKIFAQVNYFHAWQAWSPWAQMDPAAKNSFEGSSSGTGAVFKWSGNRKVGEGAMTILESRTNELIRIRLEFIKPFASLCGTEFTFKPEGNQTQVTWTMTGENNFIAKAACLFMNMDKMVGGDFERGLAQMKSVAEAAAKK